METGSDSLRRHFAQPRARAGLAVALACNLVLLTAYLWSRGGQVTDIRIQVVGDEFAVFVDGRVRLRTTMEAPEQGGVRVFAPNPRFQPATMPTRGSIESVRVTSASGDVLHETSSARELQAATGDFALVLNLPGPAWQDYTVDIRYRQLSESEVIVRANGDEGVKLAVRRIGAPFLTLASLQEAGAPESVALVSLEADASRGAKGAVATALRAYPLALALALVAVVVSVWARRIIVGTLPALGERTTRRLHRIGAGALALAVVGTTAFLLRVELDGVVNVPDEAAYIFQARILASGRTHLDTPPIPEVFQFYSVPFIIDYGGRWAAFYTPGHPLALVPGVLVGAPWVMPPLIAGANVLLLYALAKQIYGRWTALLAAALLACSPFFLMQASSYMAHNTAIAFMLAALLSAVSLRDRPWLSAALAGVFFGLLFLTRPMPAVMLAAPFGALLVGRALSATDGRGEARRIAAFALAGAVMLALYFAYNWSTTGSAFENGYQASGELDEALGFGGAHSVANGIDNEFWNVVTLVLVLNAWPAWLGLAFVLLPFVLGTRHLFDWFLLVTSTLIIASASLFITTGVFYGPRYIYEALPLLILLGARGIVCLADPPIVRARAQDDHPASRSVTLPQALVAAVAIGLTMASALGWLLSAEAKSQFASIPPSAARMDDVRVLDNRLVEQADDLNITNAVISVPVCDLLRNCYLSVFLENNLDLDGDVVWIADNGSGAAQEAIALYPCRSLYVANYYARTITPAGTAPPRNGESCD